MSQVLEETFLHYKHTSLKKISLFFQIKILSRIFLNITFGWTPCPRSGYLLQWSHVVLTSVMFWWSHWLSGVSVLPLLWMSPWSSLKSLFKYSQKMVIFFCVYHFFHMYRVKFSVEKFPSSRGLLFTLPLKSSLWCYSMVHRPSLLTVHSSAPPPRPAPTVHIPPEVHVCKTPPPSPGIFMSCSFLCLHKPRTMWPSVCFTNIYSVGFLD